MHQEVILISGGSRGIGQAIVRRLAHPDRVILFTYHQQAAAAEQLAQELSASGCPAHAFQLDVCASTAVETLLATLAERFGTIDTLIANAGIIRDNPLYLISDEDWHQVLQTNLAGTFYLCREVSRYMIRRRRGCIVTLSSTAAVKGGRGQANYAASKGGVEALTRALACELAPKNIRVNGVAPGVIETDMSAELRTSHRQRISEQVLLKRCGTAAEVAAVVNFLVSADASYMTGQILRVDGGMP